jgi:spermidine synthase
VVALLAAPLMLLMRPLPLILARQRVRQLPAGQVLYYHEDVESTVSVVQQFEFSRDLYVNRDAVAQTTRYDRPSHELIAHVPLLLHPRPERVLLIGYGIGFTTWSCRVHGVEVDVVELSGGVRRANRFFAEYNNHILDDPQVHLRIDDGRNYVLGADRRYDVIQAGIIHPGLNSGNAGFYTVDFYEDCKRLLRPGGIVAQWLPLHSMPHADCRMLIRSFQRAFPHTSVWYKHTSDFCTLVGTAGPLSIDFADLERRVAVPAVRDHLARSSVVDVYDLLDSFCGADSRLGRTIGPGPLHTDDHPYVEFHCNRPFDVRDMAGNVMLMAELREPVWPRLVNVPPERRSGARAELQKWYAGTEALIEAQWRAALRDFMSPGEPDYMPLVLEMDAFFRRAEQLNPADENARYLHRRALAFHELTLGRSLLAAGRAGEAAQHLRAAAATGGDDVYAAAEARLLLRREGLTAP